MAGMSPRVLLTKCLLLKYRESVTNSEVSSDALIEEALLTIKRDGGNGFGDEKDIIAGLQQIVHDLIATPADEINKDTIIEELRVVLARDEQLLESTETSVGKEMPLGNMRATITALASQLKRHLLTHKIKELFRTTSNKLNFQQESIVNMQDFIEAFNIELEQLSIAQTDVKDAAILSSVNFENPSSLEKSLAEARVMRSGDGIMRTGKQALNIMLQGGLRIPSLVTVNAVQHGYKSGFTDGLFCDLPMYNVPLLRDPTKKPLGIFISFEDELPNVTALMYEAIKYNETREEVDTENVPDKEISEYVISKLTRNGYHIAMHRVDPTQWSYKDIFKLVLDYEDAGYEVHFLFTDYLAQVPTTGCAGNGTTGTDLRELFRRCRGFASMKKFIFLTPHQLSPDTLGLLRVGIPAHTLVNEIHDKGYTSGSRQLDQEPDVTLFIHLFSHHNRHFLSVRRGKHRGVPFLDEKYRYAILPFRSKYPLTNDVDQEPDFYRKITEIPTVTDNSF